ncbi:MAG TPA: DUF1573 domain-containing protein [Flavobacterium sp.]|nr:DUF1573 domain-containing protein [Flavobacterium sp.]
MSKTLKISLIVAVLGLMSFTVLPGAAIVWKSDVVEVGEIPQSIPKSIEFEFRNTGDTTVLITNVQPTCGCTVAEYTKTPIKPGEKATVKATFNAANKGAFTKTIKVTTTVEETQKALTFKGTVI